MGPTTTSDATTRIIGFLKQRGLRLTGPRRAIVEAVLATTQHFTADQLLDWSRRRDPSVSRATVYRTLPLLVEGGLVREMDFGGDRKFYDPNYAQSPQHCHLICRDCGRILEFESARLMKIEAAVCQQLGFAMTTQRLQITATCEQLRLHGTCPYKQPQRTGASD